MAQHPRERKEKPKRAALLQALSVASIILALLLEFGFDRPYLSLVPFTMGVILQEAFWRLRRVSSSAGCPPQKPNPGVSGDIEGSGEDG
jgi:hypothetical protein